MTTSTDYWQKIASSSAFLQCRWTSSDELLAPLKDLDVTSHGDLLKILLGLPLQQRIAAIRLFRVLRVRSAGPVLVTCWLSEDVQERWEAKGALEDIKSRRAYKQLIRIVMSHTDTRRREEACYILAFAFDDDLLRSLQKIYAAVDYPPAVRAQAAEGFANLLDHADRRTRRYRETLELLLPGLQDPSAEVRFWTCFALGNMRATQAIPELRLIMAEDDALCPGWWYVRDEASDAINTILNKPRPDRERILSPC